MLGAEAGGMTGIDVAYFIVWLLAIGVGGVAGLRRGKRKPWKALAVVSGLLWITMFALLPFRY